MTITISKRRLVVSLLALVIVGGAAAGAYFLGRASVNQARIYTNGYNAGTNDTFNPAFNQGYTSGNFVGYTNGVQQGKQEGTAAGQAKGLQQGQTQGQNDAFDGYSGGWNIGSWYLIKIGSGQDVGLSGKYSIPSRVGPMQPGREYHLCPNGSGDTCSSALPGA